MRKRDTRLQRLKSILKEMGSVLVAFSGGVDSTFLLKAASIVLPKENILAVTADSATYPEEELSSAKKIARSLGVKHRVIETGELRDKRFISNPVNRCYFCKKELFSKLKSIAKTLNLKYIVDASSVSDKSDFRPGNIAKKELKVRSPLIEAGLTKEDIRSLSRKLGLATWDKPSLACLASRIPYGIRISPKDLCRINRAEVYLRGLGFREVRLRHYNGLCRIEVAKGDVKKVINKRKSIIDRLKKLGYNYVTVDLEGYRTGSLNEGIDI